MATQINSKVKRSSYNVFDLPDVPWIVAEGNVNDTDLEGKSIVFTVCRIGCLKTLKYLVTCGADLTIRDIYGSTCLAVVCGVGHIELVKYLVEEHNMDINEINNKNQSLVLTASKCGRLNIVQYLVEKYVDLTILDNSGLSCLIWAINRGNLHVAKYLIEQKIQPIDLNNYDNNGMDALMFACRACNFDAVKMLVEAGTNIDNVNTKGKNCLYFAMSKGKKNSEIIEYLLQKGAVLTKQMSCYNIKQANNLVNLNEDLEDDSPVLEYTDFFALI